MAMNQVWRPYDFAPNLDIGGLPVYVPDDDANHFPWLHGKWAIIQDQVGALPGDEELGCARKSMQIALNTLRVNDNGVQQQLEKWPETVQWKQILNYVIELNKVSSHGNRHFVRALKGRHMELLTTPLGRALLFDAGWRSIVLRPVNAQGWSLHVNALTADASGK